MGTTKNEASEKMTVLVVDDNEDVATMTGLILRSCGFSISVCHSGPECIKIVETTNIRAILLDLQMPYVSGYQVCQYLRATGVGNDIAIIAYSGHDAQTIKNDITDYGFDCFVSKPTNRDLLTSTIRAAILNKASQGSAVSLNEATFR